MYQASLIAQSVRNLPARQEIQVRFLGQEEGNGNPLQYSCLENPMDRGSWQATVHAVAKELDMTLQLNNSILLRVVVKRLSSSGFSVSLVCVWMGKRKCLLLYQL